LKKVWNVKLLCDLDAIPSPWFKIFRNTLNPPYSKIVLFWRNLITVVEEYFKSVARWNSLKLHDYSCNSVTIMVWERFELWRFEASNSGVLELKLFDFFMQFLHNDRRKFHNLALRNGIFFV
jgi:hypothetical protein